MRAKTAYLLKQWSVARPSVCSNAAWMGNPSPETEVLTIPHFSEFCSIVLSSALSFIFRSLQEKQINKKHVFISFEKDPLLSRSYTEGPVHSIMEIIIISLKLQLVAAFLLHCRR